MPGGGLTPLWGRLGSTVWLNCTALVPWDPAEEPPCGPPTLQWSKDGRLLTNRTEHPRNTSSWCVKTRIIYTTLHLEVHRPWTGHGVEMSSLLFRFRQVSQYWTCDTKQSPGDLSAGAGGLWAVPLHCEKHIRLISSAERR